MSRTESTTFDPITGGVSSTTTPEGTVNHAYDPATGRLTRTWTGTNAATITEDTHYDYDGLGRLWHVTPTVRLGQPTGLNASITYTYDADGNLISDTLPNGASTSYFYNGLNRLQEEKVTAMVQDVAGHATPHLAADYVYETRADGLRTHATEITYSTNGASAPLLTIDIEWSYDGLNRLTGEARSGDANTAGNYEAHYDFDLANNRTESRVLGATVDDVYSAVNARDELVASTSSLTGTTTDTYDANGSLTTQATAAGTTTYGWDLRNRLASVTASSVTTSYHYDSTGFRVSETTGSNTRTFLADTVNPTGYTQTLEERLNGTLDRSYILGNRVEAQSDSQGLAYFLRDGHGSTRMLLQGDGRIVTIANSAIPPVQIPLLYSYDAYGSPIGFDPNTARTTQLFGGDGEYDAPSGLTYHDARFRQEYRFVSMDSYAGQADVPASINEYLFAAGNPANNGDPTGHYTQAFGYAAHDVIGEAYLQTHPYSVINAPIGVFSALKPDIYDPLNRGYGEIKPLSFPGIASGLLQIVSYDQVFGEQGELGLDYHRITDWPASLTPATVIASDGESDEIVYFNVDGLIFYTNLIEDAEELKQLRNPSDLYRFLRESLKNQVETIKNTARDFAKKLLGEEEAEIDSTVAEDTLESL